MGVSDLADIKAAIIQITEETVIEDIKEDIMSHQANNISKDRKYTKNQKGHSEFWKKLYAEMKNSLCQMRDSAIGLKWLKKESMNLKIN